MKQNDLSNQKNQQTENNQIDNVANQTNEMQDYDNNNQKLDETKNIEQRNDDLGQRNRYADIMNKNKKKMPKPVKIILAVLIFGGLIAGGVFLVKKTDQTTDKNNALIVHPEYGTIETYIEGDGSIQARRQVEIGKDLKGKITKVNFKTGDEVQEGDILFSIDQTALREEIDKARKDLEAAQRDVDQSVSNLSKAQKDVSELSTVVPFSGKFIPQTPAEGETVKTYKNGDELSAGTVLGTIVDDSIMKLPLYFSYAYIDSIYNGAKANVSIPSTMSQVEGWVESVERVEKISSSGTKLFKVVIALNNPGTLSSGMVASAEIPSEIGSIMPAETGKLEYSREETITVKQSGQITSIGTMDYYRFNAGAVLVTQKNDDLNQAVETAQRTLESQRNAVSEKQKHLEELQQKAAKSDITSPISGVILEMNAVEDTEITTETNLCIVADMSSLVVNAEISMNDINSVAQGQSALISMRREGETLEISGTVESVALKANENQGNGSLPTYKAVIVLDEFDTGSQVSMGYYVEYKITTATAENCIVVPTSALVNTMEGNAVFARAAEGEVFENTQPIPEGTEGVPEGFELVPVEIGLKDSEKVQILSGISENSEVFLAGPTDAYEDVSNSMSVSIGLG